MASLAPPAAALSAAGIVMFGRRARDRRGLLLPLAVAAELAWAAGLWAGYPGFLPWARWAVIVTGVLAAAVLAAAWPWRRAARTGHQAAEAALQPARRSQPQTRRVPPPGETAASRRLRGRLVAAGVTVMLAAPVTWALSVLDPAYAGGSFNAIACPTVGGNPYHITATLTGPERRIYTYLSAHRHGASYLMAAQSWLQASPYILATGQEVLPMGGFTGQALHPAPARIQQLVRTGQLRFFQLTGGWQTGPEAIKITRWVQQACRMIPASNYRTPPAAGAPPSRTGHGPAALYQCGTSS